MATEKSSAPARPSAEDHDQDHQHACYEGVVYIGHLVEEDGDEVEEFAQYLCHRCAGDEA
jgi:hypothetical protein